MFRCPTDGTQRVPSTEVQITLTRALCVCPVCNEVTETEIDQNVLALLIQHGAKRIKPLTVAQVSLFSNWLETTDWCGALACGFGSYCTQEACAL